MSSGLLEANRRVGFQGDRSVGDGPLLGGSGEGPPDASSDLVLHAAQDFQHGLSLFAESFVVALARSLNTGLGDGDAVDCTVQLKIPAPDQTGSAFCLA